MTIERSTIRNFLVILVAAAVAAVLLLRFRPDVNSQVPPPRVQPSFQRLSALIDAHIESIFSPLDGRIPPIPDQELRALREDFADGMSKDTPQAQQMHRTAVQLCDALLVAVQERERAATGLADTRSKAPGVALSQNKKKEEEEKRLFFEVSVLRRWVDSAKIHRDKTSSLYARLRAQEREFVAASSGDGAGSAGGDTVVLQHPVEVRLRYGTTVLPAGLSLRVVSRTDAGLIVDYAGETVTLPKR